MMTVTMISLDKQQGQNLMLIKTFSSYFCRVFTTGKIIPVSIDHQLGGLSIEIESERRLKYVFSSQ